MTQADALTQPEPMDAPGQTTSVESESGASGSLQNLDAVATTTDKPSQLPTILLGFGTVVLMITIFRMLRGTSKARQSRAYKHETPRETIDRFRSETTNAREPLDTMMAEADELARRLATMLDAKAARLDALIADADARIDALTNGDATAHERSRSETLASTPAAIGSIDAQVLSLASQGMDTGQIATQLGRTAGEVDLILALRRSNDQTTA